MEKVERVEVKKIQLKIGKKEISLTPDEAKKLKEVLNDLFDKEIIKEVIKETYPVVPYWYYKSRLYPRPYYEITCDSGTVSIGTDSYSEKM